MPETFTPAWDLAALDRVTNLLASHDLADEFNTRGLASLREEIEAADEQHRAIGAAFNVERPAYADETEAGLGLAVLRSLAAVWLRVAEPLPDVAEAGDRGSADDTAPETGGVKYRPCSDAEWCARVDGHDGGCSRTANGSAEAAAADERDRSRVAREKILAEVAATLDGLVIAKDLMAYQIRDKAAIIAKTATENDDGTPVISRTNQIEAAAWLLFGALRMDGDR